MSATESKPYVHAVWPEPATDKALTVRSVDDDVIDMPVPAEWSELFVLADKTAVERAVDHILTARERLERVKAACRRAVAHAQALVQQAESFFLPELEAWAIENRPKRGKTHRLTMGSIGFRKSPERLVVSDEGSTLAWARDHLPEAVKRTESLLVSEVQLHFKRTGELPPGTELQDARETFFVGE